MARLRIDVVPVIEAKCNVAVLLNLEHDKSIAECVNDAGLNKNPLSAPRRETG
jgi:hypothetical protein